MKKELITHFTFVAAFFIFITVIKGWFDLVYIPFWVGGILGTLLPDTDHLIYVYFLRPNEAMSQKATSLLAEREYVKTFKLLATTRTQRSKLIFHTALFQILFLVFAFLVVTSSGSLLGRGIVLAFSLHLLIDQFIDLMETDRLNSWFKDFPFEIDAKQMRWFMVGMLAVLLFFGFFF